MEGKFPVKFFENFGIPREVVHFSGIPENDVPLTLEISGNSNRIYGRMESAHSRHTDHFTNHLESRARLLHL